MNSTSSSSSSTSTYTYTTTTSVNTTDAATSTYNNTLSRGTYSYKSTYTIFTITRSEDWESCPYSGSNFTIASRGISVSFTKNTTLTSNSSITESLMFNKYATFSNVSGYQSCYINSNSNIVTSWDKGVMYYNSLLELEDLATYSTAVSAGTFSKTINDDFKKNCKRRSMEQTLSFSYTYTYKNNWTATAPGTSTTTVTVGYGTNTHTESYADKQYTDSIYFTQSSYTKNGMTWENATANFSDSISGGYSWIQSKEYKFVRTTSYCRTSTNTILTNITVPHTTTLTSTR
jgi:hypothetical protein